MARTVNVCVLKQKKNSTKLREIFPDSQHLRGVIRKLMLHNNGLLHVFIPKQIERMMNLKPHGAVSWHLVIGKSGTKYAVIKKEYMIDVEDDLEEFLENDEKLLSQK